MKNIKNVWNTMTGKSKKDLLIAAAVAAVGAGVLGAGFRLQNEGFLLNNEIEMAEIGVEYEDASQIPVIDEKNFQFQFSDGNRDLSGWDMEWNDEEYDDHEDDDFFDDDKYENRKENRNQKQEGSMEKTKSHKRGMKMPSLSDLYEKLSEDEQKTLQSILGLSDQEIKALDQNAWKDSYEKLSEDKKEELKTFLKNYASSKLTDFGNRGFRMLTKYAQEIYDQLSTEQKKTVESLLNITAEQIQDPDKLKEAFEKLDKEARKKLMEIVEPVLNSILPQNKDGKFGHTDKDSAEKEDSQSSSTQKQDKKDRFNGNDAKGEDAQSGVTQDSENFAGRKQNSKTKSSSSKQSDSQTATGVQV